VSLSLNYELNLFFSYPPIASTLNEQFKEDLKYCKEVTLTEFMKQDKEKPLLEKWKELLGYGILGPLLRPGIRKYY
jgi:phosphatidylserine/phosphatidylglycerophosphate/cardiolipin synthase-like enzyme